ncbi:MAG: superoxide dismutase family protein, partial [Planctomycetaceae bacterium]|nr:superoxide dismutase family protein [Planctomycetaceae bacterium]
MVAWAQAPHVTTGAHHAMMAGGTITKAIAVLQPTKDNPGVSGTVTFTQTGSGIQVVADIHGLTPGPHGFHIHEYGDPHSPDGMSAGGHFNPTGKPHAGPTSPARHVGDLGN